MKLDPYPPQCTKINSKWMKDLKVRPESILMIAGRNINNLRHADDTTLMAENEEELKSLLMKVKEESEKADLNSTFKKLRSWHVVPSLQSKCMGKKVEALTDFIFLGSKITVNGDCSHQIKKKHLLLGRKAMTNLDGY